MGGGEVSDFVVRTNQNYHFFDVAIYYFTKLSYALLEFIE